jgi:serine/threonine protein kinase
MAASSAAKNRRLVTSQHTYEGLELIGRGGMGEVYKTQHPETGQIVAIKVLPRIAKEELRARFKREAQTIASLDHPGIINVFDFGETSGILYMVMEFVDGPNLSQLMKQHGAMSLDQVCAILTDIADALDYAHAQGFIHRDIKPSNVLLEPLAEPSGVRLYRSVITDFGLARGSDFSRLTRTGKIMGTLAYIAPEQIDAPSEVTGAADQYALAVMTYEMLTGQVPFSASNPLALLNMHLNEPPPNPADLCPDLPATTCDAVLRALDKSPQNRFATISDFVQSLG